MSVVEATPDPPQGSPLHAAGSSVERMAAVRLSHFRASVFVCAVFLQ